MQTSAQFKICDIYNKWLALMWKQYIGTLYTKQTHLMLSHVKKSLFLYHLLQTHSSFFSKQIFAKVACTKSSSFSERNIHNFSENAQNEVCIPVFVLKKLKQYILKNNYPMKMQVLSLILNI